MSVPSATRPPTFLISVAICLALAALGGCGSDATASPTALNLKKLANAYINYAVQNQGVGPPNEEAFKKYIRGLPQPELVGQKIDLANLDALFVSGRDGQPIDILYGTSITGMSASKAPLIAHEQAGAKGKRLVVYANTKVEEVDDATLQQLKAVP